MLGNYQRGGIQRNNKLNRIEIYFYRIPNLYVRNDLKSNNWKWDQVSRCWWSSISHKNTEYAISLTGCTVITPGAGSVASTSRVTKKKELTEEEIERAEYWGRARNTPKGVHYPISPKDERFFKHS